jgi:uncharacterized protein (DUF433 family)
VQGSSPIHCDPDILGGTPVFAGTRVPVHALFDYLQGGRTLEKFLDDFPTVPKELAIAALEQARRHLIDDSQRRVNAQSETGVEGGNGGAGI